MDPRLSGPQVEDPELDLISHDVLAAAIEVHRELGPSLLESTYVACMVRELASRGRGAEQQVPFALCYKGETVATVGFRADLIVDGKVLVEVKAVEALHSIHVAQVITYLRLGALRLGLLLDFNQVLLREGIRRIVQ